MALYDDYATSFVKDVPSVNLKTLVNIFMVDASVNMGNDFSDETLERAIYIIETNFRFLHVCYIASAFKKGSLGQYGAGRLVPRTIYGWLNEITMEYNRDTEHKKLSEIDTTVHFKDLGRYPLGKAICQKIDWYKSGSINSDEWDKIPLKQLAEIIGMGETPHLNDFGINI
jgi:hypothetical protein